MPGIPLDCDRLAEKLALLHLRLFLKQALFKSRNGMYRNSRGGNQLMSLQKRANFSDCGPISACATDTPILVEIGLSYPVLSRVVSWLFSMFSGEFCLRLKPYFVVKIASDVLTEHCCQVCILAMMFCRSDCRLCAGMCGKWLRNQGNSAYHVFWPVDLLTLRQATWDMKNILYIWF